MKVLDAIRTYIFFNAFRRNVVPIIVHTILVMGLSGYEFWFIDIATVPLSGLALGIGLVLIWMLYRVLLKSTWEKYPENSTLHKILKIVLYAVLLPVGLIRVYMFILNRYIN